MPRVRADSSPMSRVLRTRNCVRKKATPTSTTTPGMPSRFQEAEVSPPMVQKVTERIPSASLAV